MASLTRRSEVCPPSVRPLSGLLQCTVCHPACSPFVIIPSSRACIGGYAMVCTVNAAHVRFCNLARNTQKPATCPASTGLSTEATREHIATVQTSSPWTRRPLHHGPRYDSWSRTPTWQFATGQAIYMLVYMRPGSASLRRSAAPTIHPCARKQLRTIIEDDALCAALRRSRAPCWRARQGRPAAAPWSLAPARCSRSQHAQMAAA